MALTRLEISNFRNFAEVNIDCSPGLNLIVGENASGKTSLLEAIYYLGRARSFRSRKISDLIHHEQKRFRLIGRLDQHIIGIERGARDTAIRINGENARSLAQLAGTLPVLLLNPDSHRLLEDGPRQRRRFLDWGLFHAKPAFLGIWKRYQIALRNRNAALRSGQADRVLDAWEQELVLAAELLDSMRREWVANIAAAMIPLANHMLEFESLTMEYKRGWTEGQQLDEVLRSGRDQDRKQGYTRVGPQRGDFSISHEGRALVEFISRGQQKMLVSALMLAQSGLYHQFTGSACVLLIDDLPAELDRGHRRRLMQALSRQPGQLFITAIEDDLLESSDWPDFRAFRVDSGSIHQV